MHDICQDVFSSLVAHVIVYPYKLTLACSCADFVDVLYSIFRLEALEGNFQVRQAHR